MTQYSTLKVKLSDYKLNKLKSGIKNGTEVTLNLSSNVNGNSNDGTNFPHKLLLTNAQDQKLRKAFAASSSANVKLSKAQFSKIRQSGGFPGRIFESLLFKTGLPLIQNVLQLLAKSILVPLRLTVASIKKKIFGSGITALITLNEDMDDTIKILNSLEESVVNKTIKNEAKEQRGGFLAMLLGTFGSLGILGIYIQVHIRYISLLENLLSGKEMKVKILGTEVMRADKGTIRAGKEANRVGQDFQCCLILQQIL